MSCHKLLLLLFIIQTLFPIAVISQFDEFRCINNGTYTNGSLYSIDLNSVLHSLSSKVNDTGYYIATVGQANAAALCRADIQLSTCRSCIDMGADSILKKCPNYYQAIMWLEQCMIRYSNEPVAGRVATVPNKYLKNGAFIKTDPNGTMELIGELIDELREWTVNGSSSPRKAAAGSRSGPQTTIFALVQCTAELSKGNCNICLVECAELVRVNAGGTEGFRSNMPSCNIRYELYRFYNITRLQEPLALSSLALSPPSPSPSPSPPPLPPLDAAWNVIVIIVSIVVACLLLAVCFGIFLRKRMKKRRNPHTVEDDFSTVESIQHDFSKIRAATNDFSDDNKLGQGGFGAVYRGKLVNGREIAVKRLSRGSCQGDIEFKNEVLLVAKLQHRNLVRLLGFSIEGIERLLVYEFVPNGSLDHFIFDQIKSSNLDWETRYKIICGIAKGVLYLHEDSRLMIIHRDLKASNVLLDENMNPKIADFGMAKLVVRDETHERASRIVGTYGYMAPEYAIRGQFSIKSDVYSFGVLVMEIVSGQKKVFAQNGEVLGNLLSYKVESNKDKSKISTGLEKSSRWNNGRYDRSDIPILRETYGSQPDMMRCIHIALLCVQENAVERPTMASVVLMLNSSSIALPMPLKPGFYFSGNEIHDEIDSPSKRQLTHCGQVSNNDCSITNLYPRYVVYGV
ncbi:hypothetical protein ABFX02_03G032800 [Erythranthe guttata]